MAKRLVWQRDLVLSVRLEDTLFCLAQMREGSCMQFYDVRSRDGRWAGVDLNDARSVFCIKVAENRLKALFVETVGVDRVMPDRRLMPLRMIDWQGNGEGGFTADLIELDASNCFASIGARVLKRGLDSKKDLAVIQQHDLVGMVGDPEKLRGRLLRYFETGVDWDDAKAFIFPGIRAPRPRGSNVIPLAATTRATRAADEEVGIYVLDELRATKLLTALRPSLRKKLAPAMATLIAELLAMPRGAPAERVFDRFAVAMHATNQHAASIDTSDREVILAAFEAIGNALGLDPGPPLERWRGDW